MKKTRGSFRLGEQEIAPGTRETVNLPAAFLYTHAELSMPVHVVHGRRDGPCLFVSAAVHGDEINGVAITRRLMQHPALKRIRGTLLAVPVVNVHGFLNRSRYLPDRRDLNRSFPGSPQGSLASRAAHLFMEEIVSRAQFGIDLHTGSNFRANLPQVRAQLDDPDTARIAQAFGAPVLLDAALRAGSLRQEAEKCGVTVIVYEGGEALRFDEWVVRTGVRGIVAVMRETGMLPPAARPRRVSRRHFSRSSTWVRAPQSGILQGRGLLGMAVQAGQQLGLVTDPFGENEMPLQATVSGVVIGQTTLPLVNEGEAVYHIARFADPQRVVASIEILRQDFDAETEPPPDPAPGTNQ
jgi:uncharacterized protein